MPQQILRNIFEIGHGTLATYSLPIVYDAWESFRQVYGNYGLHGYSKPLYNPFKTIVVLLHENQGHWIGAIYALQKEKVWIS